MQILIVEDELLIAEMLKEMLLELGHKVVAIAKNYELALSKLEEIPQINFCFIDINLKTEKSGLDVATFINENNKIPFAFLTSYSDKVTVANAMEFKPQAYLIKPFTEMDLFTTIELVKARQHTTQNVGAQETILIKEGNKSIKINIEDITWVKSDNVYVEINTNSKKYLVRNSLAQFLEESNSNSIKRVHRTYAVNVKKIDAISGQILLIGSAKIPISRKHRDEVITSFK